MNLAVLLQALRLTPGMRVLEFGAGSGWLSRFLTQMGCRVVLLDVSPTALRMARELYAAAAGHRRRSPRRSSSLFDGRRIDLPGRQRRPDRLLRRVSPRAESARDDRASSARVLADGGIAGFAEPGPRHAEAPRSQFESQTYGVVERDVDVHDIWRTAQAARLRPTCAMCVFHGPPFQVSLDEYEQLLAGGTVAGRWLASTRKFLRHVRIFCLVKGGDRPAPTAAPPAGLACDIRVVAAIARGRRDPSSSTRSSRTPARRPGCRRTSRAAASSLGTHLYDAVRRAGVVRLPRRAADRSAAGDRAGRDRARPRHAAAARRPGATASSSIAWPPTSPGSRRRAHAQLSLTRRQ